MVKYKSGDVYCGMMQAHTISGFGHLTENNHDSYLGLFRQGGKHGQGLYLQHSKERLLLGVFEYNLPSQRVLTNYVRLGHMYLGTFLNDHRVQGEYHFNDSRSLVYKGSYSQDQYSGYGEFYWLDASHYKGHFQHNVYHGQGIYRFAQGHRCISYQGDFQGGLYNGTGKFVWASGKVHTGLWKDNLEEGLGTTLFQDGAHYKGNYVKGKRQGQGEYVYSNGDKYTGQWHNGIYQGQGSLYRKEQNSLQEGTWVRGFLMGEGSMKSLTTGEVYLGGFQESLRHGKGLLVYGPNQERWDRFEGLFYKGIREGLGRL